jgi:hypothetical protein
MVSMPMIQPGCDQSILFEDDSVISKVPMTNPRSSALFNADWLIRIHALIISGAVERNEFAQQVMQAGFADWWQWMRAALRNMKMNTLASQRDAAMGDWERRAHGLRALVEREGWRLRFRGPLEAKR